MADILHSSVHHGDFSGWKNINRLLLMYIYIVFKSILPFYSTFPSHHCYQNHDFLGLSMYTLANIQARVVNI
ncbi:hypothetical protein AUEXF2481DRAFT_636381 [Aureobasidium subglaciale EXF-2481]|uniref:Uncharacterized protein n=1 Tax=Aureobasidium subglaciale (strain EXF-2481) TaxID=1043005 RepID=A0A074YQK9_AURSE|nr:uncharacterized protein AUEXF2481DRAFT_636381 [Aureobasidium subglaciale EXF-2481]KEQ96387.1 hypothetical protein AUEXF2481DRAFT_636381 [Aureobasidium subglaciale EXF-2481]